MKQLYGGYRNQVFQIDNKIKIIWKDGHSRKEKIKNAVLLENFIAAHTDIKSRLLIDKSQPIQIEKGELVTYFHSALGETRYPWNLAEISSAAKLMAKLHLALNPQLFVACKDTPYPGRSILMKQEFFLHLDFARNNVLFAPNTSSAIGVIDFETANKGPLEQDLGRTLSFILIDTPHKRLTVNRSQLAVRMNALLTNYPLPYKKDQVLFWTKKYLKEDDYGTLNSSRDQVLKIVSM